MDRARIPYKPTLDPRVSWCQVRINELQYEPSSQVKFGNLYLREVDKPLNGRIDRLVERLLSRKQHRCHFSVSGPLDPCLSFPLGAAHSLNCLLYVTTGDDFGIDADTTDIGMTGNHAGRKAVVVSNRPDETRRPDRLTSWTDIDGSCGPEPGRRVLRAEPTGDEGQAARSHCLHDSTGQQGVWYKVGDGIDIVEPEAHTHPAEPKPMRRRPQTGLKFHGCVGIRDLEPLTQRLLWRCSHLADQVQHVVVARTSLETANAFVTSQRVHHRNQRQGTS